VDVERERLQAATSASLPQSISQPVAAWPAQHARPVLPVLSVEAKLRRRALRVFTARLWLFLFDALMINLGFLGAYYIRFELLHGVTFTSGYIDIPRQQFVPLQAAITVGLLLAFVVRGLYAVRITGTWFKQVTIIIAATSTAFAVFAAYEFILERTDLAVVQTRLLVALSWGTTIVAVSLARLLVGALVGQFYRRGVGLTNLLVVGSGRIGKVMMQHVAASPHLGYRMVGFIHDLDGPVADFGRFKALGTLPELDEVIRTHRVDETIVALPANQHQQILRAKYICERAGATFKLVPDLYELSLSRIDVDAIQEVPLLGVRRPVSMGWQRAAKRLIDVAVAGTVLILGLPIWLLVALAIKLDSPGPVLFSQERIGYRSQPFPFLKFRSMHIDAEQRLARLRDTHDDRIFKSKQDPRRTRVGRLIRPTSIDEIPQLINVLRGEMSLVGPRPLPPYESTNYSDWERRRFDATPGMTGLWQVRGRSDITFDEMVLMDLYYVENWSLRLDLQIMLRTIPAVLMRRGAY
jgi:exopolysaccharide biosynthesis polyprenyl glycosylphosphotransferase